VDDLSEARDRATDHAVDAATEELRADNLRLSMRVEDYASQTLREMRRADKAERELQEAQADAAVMREALEEASAALLGSQCFCGPSFVCSAHLGLRAVESALTAWQEANRG